MEVPQEAWDAVLKSGNAAAVVLGILWWRTNEAVQALRLDVALLKQKLGMTGDTK